MDIHFSRRSYGKHVFTLKELVINSSLLYSFLIYEESSTAYSRIGGSHVPAILAFGRWKQKDQEVQGCPWQGTKFEVILGSMRPCLTNSGTSFLPGVIPTHCPSEQTTFPDCSWLALHLALCADTLEGHHLARAAYTAAVTYVLSFSRAQGESSVYTAWDVFWGTWSRDN